MFLILVTTKSDKSEINYCLINLSTLYLVMCYFKINDVVQIKCNNTLLEMSVALNLVKVLFLVLA